MTALPARQSPPQQPLLEAPTHGPTISHFDLTPATAKRGNSELLACLILVAPSGMTEDDRGAWLRAAKMTLTGIPADLLARGCRKARETCRFPAEIVPAILSEVGDSWNYRKRLAADAAAQHANRHAPRLERQEPEYVDPAEVRKLIKSLGRA